jgi:hypothetical protein
MVILHTLIEVHYISLYYFLIQTTLDQTDSNNTQNETTDKSFYPDPLYSQLQFIQYN